MKMIIDKIIIFNLTIGDLMQIIGLSMLFFIMIIYPAYVYFKYKWQNDMPPLFKNC